MPNNNQRINPGDKIDPRPGFNDKPPNEPSLHPSAAAETTGDHQFIQIIETNNANQGYDLNLRH